MSTAKLEGFSAQRMRGESLAYVAQEAMDGYERRTGKKATVLIVNPATPVSDLEKFGLKIETNRLVWAGQVLASDVRIRTYEEVEEKEV